MRSTLIILLSWFVASGCGPSPASGGTGGGTGNTGAPGSCVAPSDVTLPFSTGTEATTSGNPDLTSLTCGTVPNLADAVYRTTLGAAATLHVTGSDSSGQGVGLQIRTGDCNGASVACIWKSSGVLDETFILPAGTYVLIYERNPTGKFAATFR